MAKNKMTLALITVAMLAAAFMLLNQPDRRTPGQKVGEAIDAMSEGAENAAKKLEDRTPAEKFSDQLEKSGIGQKQ